MGRLAIYEQHDKAFNKVSAFVIMKGPERVATIAFKFPADGAGRLWCYLHVLSLPMVRGYAGGYGYDKKSAAFSDAAGKAHTVKLESWQTGKYETERAIAADMFHIAATMGGKDWNDALRVAGYTVLQAV